MYWLILDLTDVHQVPCGVGEAIAVRSCPKILILNTTHDRETAGMTASAFVVSICDALNRKYCNDPCLSLQHKVSFAKEAIVDMLVTNVRVKSSTFLELESEVHCVLLN
jgi:hypothetical protein